MVDFLGALIGLGLAWPLIASPLAAGQSPRPLGLGPDSVDIVAGARYGAGGFHRLILGAGYRDLWATSVKVEVLDLDTFAGGLHPLKEGGGNQTKSLRFVTPDGVQYAFRSVDKADAMAARFKGTIIQSLFRDQISSSDPGAPLVAARLLDAAGVLHVTPILVVMPDDPRLGEFRKHFAGQLGLIEQSPGTPKHHVAFAGAVEIIDSDSLHILLNADPEERIDAGALLAARLMDMLFGDWDRHAGQWKWARMQASPRSDWLPIPRDRDKTFISYGGVIPGLAGLALPNVFAFEGSYPSVRGLTFNSVEFDRRMLGGLEKPVWDSVARDLQRRITDSIIDDAVRAVPVEYLQSAPELARKLKLRRDALPGAADRFYRMIAAVADIHATDAPDRLAVTLIDDRFVEVRLSSGCGTPYFARRFDRLETSEIRIYLHGGSDTALVSGRVHQSIPLRIIGGNGANLLIDSSRVDDAPDWARLYGRGAVAGEGYGPDTLYNREPWIRQGGKLVAPGRDRGGRIGPTVALNQSRDLGFVPQLGFASTTYGFGRRPYASRAAVDLAYSTKTAGLRIGLITDRRFEGTAFHLVARARASDLEVLSFHGFGNATADSTSAYFEARQRQWLFQPAVALALGPRSDFSLGPVLQYSVTDSAAGRFIAKARPYGFGSFGQAGLELGFHHDGRDSPRDPHRGVRLDVTGSYFPGVWDVKSAFEEIAGRALVYFTFPVPAHPIVALSGGGKKVFGAFPYHEAAFIGGLGTIRSLDGQRYLGDASVYGAAELRIPVARFALLVPWNVGVFGVVETGRVYLDGASPGGWHTARGLGFWIGILDPSSAVRVCWRPSQGGPC